ncbi:MAG: phosphatidate cytidylyltransferase [Myxococcaceae bacterium]
MNDKNRNLVLRIASALILLPLILFLLGKGGYFSAGLMSVAAALCAMEFFTITQKKLSPAALIGMAVAFLCPLLPALFPREYGELSVWLVTVYFLFVWTYFLLRGPHAEAPVLASQLVTGLVYGSLPLMALAGLRLREDGLGWVVCTLALTWLNDTFAYFAGRFLGKHKLYPKVSPNKTWEGFAGGLVGSVVGMICTKLIFFPSLTYADCVLLGVAGGLLGPVGDLTESMLKRAYGVKDSGNVVPGHGGVLDRIDALLFNAPLVFLYVQYFRPLLRF